MKYLLFLLAAGCFVACSQSSQKGVGAADYFATQDSGVQTGNIKLVSIQTPKGKFHVWTKRFGNNPRIKVLLSHRSPRSDA